MIRNTFIVTSFCFIFYFGLDHAAMAQNEVRVKRSEFKTGSEGLGKAYRHIKKGNSWVKSGKGAIDKAVQEYLVAYKFNCANPELNYKIGVAYLHSAQKANALEYLTLAYNKKPDIVKNIQFLLARAYHCSMVFDTAIEKYNTYYTSLSKRQKRKQSDAIFKYIDECKAGKELIAQPKRAAIKNLGEQINTVYDDYNALLTDGDSTMYFTSRRPNKKRERPNKKSYMFDEDIYISHLSPNGWQKSEYLTDEDFNTKHNEDIVWISADGKSIYLYDGFLRGGDILVSTNKKGKWKSPKRISRRINTKACETSASLTRDGKTIYFVSDAKDESIGGKDIYVSHQNERGRWEVPTNLGSVINTKYDEEWVCVSPNGKVLYFSSKGHNTMGGYDIFRSEQDGGGKWTKPVNVGVPVNTPDDELFYRPAENERSAYFAAKRPDTHGGFDIYKIIYLGAEKKMMLNTEEQLVAYFNKPVSDIFARISGEEKIDTVYFMVGTITDAKRKTPILAKLDLIDIDRSIVAASTMSDTTGNYRIKLPELKKYGVEVHAKDYMLFLDVVNIPPKIQGRDVTRNFTLAKVEVGTKIVLKNIYFETGKAVLTRESYTELDKVVKFMQDNPEIKVEISGHTDNVGTQLANTKLSESRAKAVVDYLISKNIPQEKLVYKGYGFAQPMAPNTTAAGRKLNRRVEFKILSVE